MKDKEIIKKLYDHFDKIDFCVFTDEGYQILHVHHGLSIVFIENKAFSLSFEVSCDPTAAGIITQEIIEFASKLKMEVRIFEPFADVANEEGIIETILFGDDATHYYETGELPQAPEEKSKKEEEDVEKKFDNILDQISSKGMKLLNTNQKQFLENYSKGKQQHKH